MRGEAEHLGALGGGQCGWGGPCTCVGAVQQGGGVCRGGKDGAVGGARTCLGQCSREGGKCNLGASPRIGAAQRGGCRHGGHAGWQSRGWVLGAAPSPPKPPTHLGTPASPLPSLPACPSLGPPREGSGRSWGPHGEPRATAAGAAAALPAGPGMQILPKHGLSHGSAPARASPGIKGMKNPRGNDGVPIDCG